MGSNNTLSFHFWIQPGAKIFDVCIHPPLYTCCTLEERCDDRSPPMNTNEQLAVICLGIRDEAERRARSPRNE